MRRYSTGAERQDAYRSARIEAALPALYLPALRPLSTVSETGRWRFAVDLAARLLQNVGEEMRTYLEQRTDPWHASARAEDFHETLDLTTDAQEQLDELRSRF